MFNRDKMNLNSFSLGVTATDSESHKVKINETDYFSLAHGSEYSLSLSNDKSVRCDAYVYIDGEKVGVWRINPRSTIHIERPQDIKRKFVFLAEESQEANEAGIPKGNSNNGLVKVVFKPEKYPKYLGYQRQNSKSIKSALSNKSLENNILYDSLNYESGATGLGDHSFQTFSTVSKLNNIDQTNVTTIQTRLIVPKNSSSYNKVVRLKDGLKGGLKSTYPPRVDIFGELF